MKRLLVIVIAFLTLACSESDYSKQDKGSPKPNQISLLSPQGFRLAPSIDFLKAKIVRNAEKAFGKKTFKITKIDYTEATTQIAALVEFESNEGEIGTVLIVGGKSIQSKGARIKEMMLAGETIVDCKGDCDSPNEGCREKVIIANDGTISYECTCQGSCKMTVTQGP